MTGIQQISRRTAIVYLPEPAQPTQPTNEPGIRLGFPWPLQVASISAIQRYSFGADPCAPATAALSAAGPKYLIASRPNGHKWRDAVRHHAPCSAVLHGELAWWTSRSAWNRSSSSGPVGGLALVRMSSGDATPLAVGPCARQPDPLMHAHLYASVVSLAAWA